MNFRLLLLIVFLASYSNFYGQEDYFQKPNYRKIKKRSLSKKSNYYFPKLMKIFLRNSKSMTLKEKRSLYYGFAFQHNYKPYGSSKYKVPIRKILGVRKKSKPKIEELLANIKMHLRDNPFDIEMLKIKVYAYRRLGLMNEAMNVKHQMQLINEVIMSSGNGKSKAKAFHIIKVKHQDALLQLLNYKRKGHYISMKKYEFIELEDNPEKVKGLYFNLSQGLKAVN